MIDKASIANIIASIAIISGIVSVFLAIPSNEMLVLITGAGIGYLFKNGIISHNNDSNVPSSATN